ncbi:hypothetical protein PPYR_06689 [Photinus pyralis]|uniref:Uncharacterized protein n=3 Tax=Photinus pyralis TaxID=7054 RepID=A0A5N4ANA7_PHOPY|nr:hypothetical protein PPYR_06689 [Photinus pyralis]
MSITSLNVLSVTNFTMQLQEDFKETFPNFLEYMESKILCDIHQFKERRDAWKKIFRNNIRDTLVVTSNTFTNSSVQCGTNNLNKKHDLLNKRDECLLKLKQLQYKEEQLKAEISQNATNLNHYRDLKLNKGMNEENMLMCRNLCKASKELFKTTFNYKSQDVSGFIVGPDENIEPFKVTKKAVSVEEVSSTMWKHICRASGEDCNFS